MRKIGLYQYLTTFCIIPTFDWSAFAQRLVTWLKMALAVRLILSALGALYNLVKTPLFLMGLYLALLWFPDTIQWIFMQIGLIQLKIFMILLSTVMPDVFTFGGSEVASWATIWQQGLSNLPSEMLEVINGLGAAEMLGLVTSTLMAGSTMVVYRKIMLRAGLL